MKRSIYIAALLLVLLVGVVIYQRQNKLVVRNIINRLPKHPSKTYNRRKISQIDRIIIHHSATPLNQDAFDFARYHVNNKKWAGIGYHYVINPDGQVDQTNQLTTISYHASGCNTRGVGICLVGNFDLDRPTEKQLNALALLIDQVRQEIGRSVQVIGHRDCTPTSCPGLNFNLGTFKTQYLSA